MAYKTGQKYYVEMGAPGGSPSYTKVGHMRTKALNLTRQTIDTSSDANPDYASSISGQRSLSFNGEAILEVTDAGHALLIEAWESDEAYLFRFTSDETPHIEVECEMFVNDLSIGGGTNEVVTASITAQSTNDISIDVITE